MRADSPPLNNYTGGSVISMASSSASGWAEESPDTMKTLRLLLAVTLAAIGTLAAQQPATDSAEPAPIFTAEQLDQLLAPIALYPDALIALILPAATVPADIVLAARYVKDNPGNLSQVEHRAWDDSVKSLTHYPEVLQWLDENLTWTKQVGEAFLAQPADVMNAIQRLRAKARASGTLTDTPQQQVLTEPNVIRIVPADPEIIYVPRYDPAVVFVDRPLYYSYSYPAPLITFGLGWRVGSWLAYDFDWHRCRLWVGDRHRHWPTRHDWHRPLVPIGNVSRGHTHVHPPARVWQPPARFHRPPSISPPSRPHGYPPASSATLARTYGRTGVPAVPPAPRPPPSVTRSPTPMDMDLTPRVYRPDTSPRQHPRTTVTTQPRTGPRDHPAAQPPGPRGDRSWPQATPDAPTSRIVRSAPALSMVGPVAAERATVVPARPATTHLGHSGSATRIRPQAPPPSVSPPVFSRTHAAPPPPSTPVAAPPAASRPSHSAPPPAGRPTHGDTRAHSRPRDLP